MNNFCKGAFSLILWYLPVALVQFISAHITISSLNPWYQTLQKGIGTPPSWVFGPTWTILYIMMTVAVWMVYRAETTRAKHAFAYVLFFTQLFANSLWSFLFFGFHLPGWALIDLGLLILLILLTTVCFFHIRKLAGFLLLPYLLWSAYAFYLNAAIWWLN